MQNGSNTVAQAGTGRALFGGILVVLGILFFLDQFFVIDLGRQSWPLFVIVPGVLLCGAALAVRGAAGEGLFIFGSMVMATGLLLAYQNSTDHWEGWAYAWALVAPGSVGLGQTLYGLLMGRPDSVSRGTKAAIVGVVLFVCFGAFFESVLHISGGRQPLFDGYFFPMLLIGAGLVMLFANLMPGRSGRPQVVPFSPSKGETRQATPGADAPSGGLENED